MSHVLPNLPILPIPVSLTFGYFHAQPLFLD